MKFKIASAHTKLAVLGMAVVALSAAFPKLSDGQDLVVWGVVTHVFRDLRARRPGRSL